MMRIIEIKSILVAVCVSSFIVLTSCGEEKSKEKKEAKTQVSLNEGKRWPANPETKVGVKNMLNLLNNPINEEDRQTYIDIQIVLKSEFQMIFDKCSMEGEGHDQLHNYLLPMMKMFKDLGSDDLLIQKKTYDEITVHLNKFTLFFE